jgi:hypothetical protein
MEEEIEIWKENIKSIAIEIEFYQRLLNLVLIKRTTVNVKKNSFFTDKLLSVNWKNNGYRENLVRLKNNIEQLKECDDMQCEMYFLDKHSEFKKGIEMYFSEYRGFKNEFFVYYMDVLRNISSKTLVV